jgi:hypothetical protein
MGTWSDFVDARRTFVVSLERARARDAAAHRWPPRGLAALTVLLWIAAGVQAARGRWVLVIYVGGTLAAVEIWFLLFVGKRLRPLRPILANTKLTPGQALALVYIILIYLATPIRAPLSALFWSGARKKERT